MPLIGISAKIQNGKDTIADYLIKYYGFRREAFADPLKDAAAPLTFENRAVLDTQEGKAEINKFLGIPNRVILQAFGQVMRENFPQAVADLVGYTPEALQNQLFWVSNFLYRQPNLETDNIVTTDVRYPNEADRLRKAGGILIRHDRRDWVPDPKVNAHSSETSLDDYLRFDWKAVTSTVSDMLSWTDQIMKFHSIKRTST